MDILIFESFSVQFLLPEVIIIPVSKLFELPKESSLLCIYHSMCYLLEFFVRLNSWVFEEVSIYSGYLMCLAELYWCTAVVFVYGCIYPISSINHSKVRVWISSMRQIMKEYFIILFCFLEDMFGCENISSNAIYGHKESPLAI